MSKIIDKIKKEKWGNSLTRSGFLQSKVIAVEAIMSPIKLTNGVNVRMDSYVWVNNFVAYSMDSINSFPALFKKAFGDDDRWPLSIINDLDKLAEKKNLLVKKMKFEIKSVSQAIGIFRSYINLLHEIQKYYVIAVPITDYCEGELIKLGFKYSNFAVAYKKLDIDLYNQSLRQITLSTKINKKSLIERHLKNFAWIKTAYNIIDTYTESDLMEALKSLPIEPDRKFLPKKYHPVLVGLQCGIFMRNRMKELSQQLWFAFNPVATYLADYLSLSREDFLMLTPKEVFDSVAIGTSKISNIQIKERKKGFVAGFIKEKFILLAGDSVSDLFNFFNPNVTKNILEFKGNVACKGRVKGIVKIIKTKKDFSMFNKGEILVTSMTTPDFILIMKKSLAIITDEGGLSCHAAIVSRELNIPCIIGTKIATKVLKDGDLVEVDANKGKVSIL